MKTTSILAAVAWFVLTGSAVAQVVEDDFNDSIVDMSLWSVLEPDPSSDVSEANGVLTLENSGRITALESFVQPEITGRFRFTGHFWDIFTVVLRTNGGVTLGAEPVDGLSIQFYPEDHPDSLTGVKVWRLGSPRVAIASGGAKLALNTFYDFRIVDTGSEIEVYLTDLTNPLIVLATTHDPGDLVVLRNRGPQGLPYVVNLDHVQIAGFVEAVDLKVNGSDEPASLVRGEPLTVTADLVADPAIDGDTWILALTSQAFPLNIFAYDLNTGSWIPWLFTLYGPSAQGAIPEFQFATLLQSNGLPDGFYTFYLGYDRTSNRRIDFDALALDAVSVLIGN